MNYTMSNNCLDKLSNTLRNGDINDRDYDEDIKKIYIKRLKDQGE